MRRGDPAFFQRREKSKVARNRRVNSARPASRRLRSGSCITGPEQQVIGPNVTTGPREPSCRALDPLISPSVSFPLSRSYPTARVVYSRFFFFPRRMRTGHRKAILRFRSRSPAPESLTSPTRRPSAPCGMHASDLSPQLYICMCICYTRDKRFTRKDVVPWRENALGIRNRNLAAARPRWSQGTPPATASGRVLRVFSRLPGSHRSSGA